MKFIDRVKQLEEIVLEKKEVPDRDLVSLLQVGPNYVLQLKKQVLRGGKVVEEWLDRDGPNGVEKHLIERSHYQELVRKGDLA
jgi:hypothetical protein